jgi:UDP-MurNAc hydroxylase
MRIKNAETVSFQEFQVTLFAPFARHNFHDATVGNLIDSAMLIACQGIAALNANDNTLTPDAAQQLRERFGEISLAMLNYNAAGPYPSCFDNLTEAEKCSEHARVLQRNFNHMKTILQAMKPRFILPFAGEYVLGGDLHYKNVYLGTTTWDECAHYLESQDIGATQVVRLRENDTLNLQTGTANRPYVPIDVADMKHTIEQELSRLRYPYQTDVMPDPSRLIADLETAAERMKTRMSRFELQSRFSVRFTLWDKQYQIYPEFLEITDPKAGENRLECRLDERLLRRILDKESHWNNAEIGAHISFIRTPNTYEPDLHTSLQFLYL